MKESFGDNQLKGNWGEQYIASELTACDCLIRHVPQGHDSGIDLYCESIKDGKPFLHFFVQVKTSISFDSSSNSCKFCEKKKDKIIYWKKQPVPVFIFFVPDERKKSNPPYFIGSTLDFNGKKTIDSRLKINSKEDLKNKFFGECKKFSGLLIEETFRLSLLKGHLSPLPNSENSSMMWFPEKVMISPHNLKNVTITLHNALWRISEDLLGGILDFQTLTLICEENDLVNKLLQIEPYMIALESIICLNKVSNVSRVTIGLWYFIKGNHAQSQKWIKDGISLAKKQISKTKDKNTKDHIKKQLEQSERYLCLVNEKK